MTFPWEKSPRSIDWLLEQNDKNAVWNGPLCDDEGCPRSGVPHVCVSDPLGIPAFLRRDANNRAPFMDVVATKPQPQACTEPPLMPWSADFNKPTE